MKIYLRSSGNVSPQKTFGDDFFSEPTPAVEGDSLKCLEPSYGEWIDKKALRRMSRMVKMGLAAALRSLRSAGLPTPEAVVTATAYGCLEDTADFLTQTIREREDLLTPTAFIQSTHNTLGAQIALYTGAHGYNNTFAHGVTSFESALLDATLLLQEGRAGAVLLGAADESTEPENNILRRFGFFKKRTFLKEGLFASHSKGTLSGEGAAFFVLSKEPSPQNLAELSGFTTFADPKGAPDLENKITAFLSDLPENPLRLTDIDLVITGRNGDSRSDGIYDALEKSCFAGKKVVPYKHLCGEYPTSSAFALWLAAEIAKTGVLPRWLANSEGPSTRPHRRILICHHPPNARHSLMLVSSC